MFLSAVAAQKQPPGTVVDGDLGARLDAAVGKSVPGFWGAVAVAQAGKTVFAKGYGMADAGKTPCGPRSLFDVGTLANPTTVAAALVLIGERKLTLATPLGKVLRDWPADKQAITVEHLIRHTSGLPPEADWSGGTAAGQLRTAVAAIARCKLVREPGKAFAFSHLNSCVLAMVVEEASGARFERYVQERVLKATGMVDAGFLGDAGLDDKRMTLRKKDPGSKGQPVGAGTLNWAIRGARGLVATPLDVQAFGQALCQGRFVDDAGGQWLLAPLAGGDAYQVEVLKVGAAELVQVRGQTEGYRARLLLHRASRSTIVVCGNGQAQLDPLVQALASALLVGLPPAPPPVAAEPAPSTPPGPEPAPAPVASGSAAQRARFVGTFDLPAGGSFAIVEQSGGLLLLGRGLQGSARVGYGSWPPPKVEDTLRTAEDRGLALLAAMVQDERTAFGDAFAGDDASLAARRLWDEAQRQHGKPSSIELLGTQVGEPTTSWFQVVFGSTPVRWQVTWAGARFAAIRVAAGELPFQLPLQVVRADVAVATTRSGQALMLTVEGEGADRCLVFEDGSGGAGGLLECRLRR